MDSGGRGENPPSSLCSGWSERFDGAYLISTLNGFDPHTRYACLLGAVVARILGKNEVMGSIPIGGSVFATTWKWSGWSRTAI